MRSVQDLRPIMTAIPSSSDPRSYDWDENYGKWKGLFIAPLFKVLKNLNDNLLADADAMEYVEGQLLKLLAILTAKPSPVTVAEVEVKRAMCLDLMPSLTPSEWDLFAGACYSDPTVPRGKENLKSCSECFGKGKKEIKFDSSAGQGTQHAQGSAPEQSLR